MIKNAIQINTNLGKPRKDTEELDAKQTALGIKYFKVSDLLRYIFDESNDLKDEPEELQKMREE